MKVYVVKRIDNKYLSKYSNYDYRLENPCEPCWTEKLYNAKIFEEYDETDNFCNTIDCQIVECSFMENFELSYLIKKAKKEVCDEILSEFDTSNANNIDEKLYPPTQEAILISEGFKACKKRLLKKLDQIQGGTNG